MGLIRVRRDFSYHHEPWRDCIIMKCGETTGRVRVDYECTRDHDCWRLQFTATVAGDVRYSGPRSLRHEQRHVEALHRDALEYFSYLVPAEHRRYISKDECRDSAEAAMRRLRQMPFDWERRQRPIDWYIFY